MPPKGKPQSASGKGAGKEEKISKKEAARLKKEEAQRKLEEQQQREREMHELRERVRKLVLYTLPPTPLDFVASVLPTIRRNPWMIIHDARFSAKFLDDLLTVLQQYAHVNVPQMLREVSADIRKTQASRAASASRAAAVASRESILSTDSAALDNEDVEAPEAVVAPQPPVVPSVADILQSLNDIKEPTQEQQERANRDKLALLYHGIRDLSEFAMGQPVRCRKRLHAVCDLSH